MRRLLSLSFLLFAISVSGLVGSGHAGQNAGATARMYWLASNTSAIAGVNCTASTVQLLVTVKGASNFRGADVQLCVGLLQTVCFYQDDPGFCFPAGYYPLPEAWQAQSGGPAEDNYVPKIGGFNGGSATVWPDVFKASPSVINNLVAQTGAMRAPLCVSPQIPNAYTIWLSAAGAAPAARDPNKEYAVFGFTLRLDTGLRGDALHAGGPLPVRVWPFWRLPCGSGYHGSVLVVVDGNAVKDYATFDSGYDFRDWHAEIGLPTVPVKPNTWGLVRRLYR